VNAQQVDRPARLLVVGSVALDDIEWPACGMRRGILGGAASFFSTAASFFVPVRMVGVVGGDFPAEHGEFFRGRGIDLEGLERVGSGTTFRWVGRYHGLDLARRETLDTRLGVFEHFKPRLPEAYRASEFVFLANIHPALQIDVREQMSQPRLVACDTMNFWISGQPEALRRMLRRVDLLVINDEEARQLSGVGNLVRAAAGIGALGPGRVIIKRGDAGALLFANGEILHVPAYPLEEVLDPTGAGDSFAGGFMGYVARTGDLSIETLRRATAYGSILGSFCVEGYGLDRLRTLGEPEIHARYATFRRLTHFDG
jgi:sugar/nucleoside kinase (ribokinase family)